jgi:hypothetical protein
MCVNFGKRLEKEKTQYHFNSDVESIVPHISKRFLKQMLFSPYRVNYFSMRYTYRPLLHFKLRRLSFVLTFTMIRNKHNHMSSNWHLNNGLLWHDGSLQMNHSGKELFEYTLSYPLSLSLSHPLSKHTLNTHTKHTKHTLNTHNSSSLFKEHIHFSLFLFFLPNWMNGRS